MCTCAAAVSALPGRGMQDRIRELPQQLQDPKQAGVLLTMGDSDHCGKLREAFRELESGWPMAWCWARRRDRAAAHGPRARPAADCHASTIQCRAGEGRIHGASGALDSVADAADAAGSAAANARNAGARA